MDYQAILKQYWGYDSFRGIQEDIIRSIGEGRDTLGLMPTGGGKSVTFQVPALAQVQNLKRRGIKALAVYSGMNRQEIITTLENAIFGNYKFLYISPERLDTEIFRIKLDLVDNKSNNVMNGIAFGQSSHVRYIKTKRSFDICCRTYLSWP